MKREKLLMNDGWKFRLGDIDNPPINGHQDTYMHSKSQCAQGAATSNYYDMDFRDVTLPHDYVIEGDYSEKANGNHGSLFRHNAWYRRYFTLSEEDKDKRIIILFEGAGKDCVVWLNDHLAYRNHSMYNSFYVDITNYVLYNEMNTLAVYINNEDFEGWWYEGGGIYRNVWLIKTDKIAVDMWGTFVNPKKLDDHVWEVNIETTIHNIEFTSSECTIISTVKDKQGNIVGEASKDCLIKYGKNKVVQSFSIKDPILWDIDSPYLYTLVTTVMKDNKIIDEYNTLFGFRTIKFDKDRGFFLNGRPVKLHGGCMHQDHSNLGVAVPKRVWEYRIRKMKEVGFNACRCAHNNPSPEFLEVCDELGMLVIDENRHFSTNPDSLRQLNSMILRDRNHPCIIAWSVGNEEPLQSTYRGKKILESMKAYVKSKDDTRPVTIALNGGFFDSFAAKSSDVVAINYGLQHYDKLKEVHEDKAIISTESVASRNTRGIYFPWQQEEKGYSSAYDEKRASFGSTFRDAIKYSETRDFISGTFIWAAIDYRGEASWPQLFSSSGVFDSCCFEKDSTYLVKAMWRKDVPVLHIMPHWNWKGHEGEEIKVYVYSNADEVELFLNGKSLGRKNVEVYEQPYWMVRYEPGLLKAVSYKDGKVYACKEMHTTSQPCKIVLNNETPQVYNDGYDVAIINVHMVDEKGRFVPDADYRLSFEVCENGEILSVGNGDPADHENAKRTDRRLFGGLCQVILRIKKGAKTVKLTAKCRELECSSELVIDNIIDRKIKEIPAGKHVGYIRNFRKWPNVFEKPDINMEYNYDDMNTSEPIELNNFHGIESEKTFYHVLTSVAITPNFVGERKLSIIIEEAVGSMDICIKHAANFWPYPKPKKFSTKIFEKTTAEKETMHIPLEGFGPGEKVYITIHVENSKDCSIKGMRFHVE